MSFRWGVRFEDGGQVLDKLNYHDITNAVIEMELMWTLCESKSRKITHFLVRENVLFKDGVIQYPELIRIHYFEPLGRRLNRSKVVDTNKKINFSNLLAAIAVAGYLAIIIVGLLHGFR